MSEIERKFVVERLPAGVDASRGDEILQGYVSAGEELEVRLRRRAARHFLTFKSPGDLVREEVEIEIGEEAFRALWPLTTGRRLEKRRVLVPVGARLIEVDVFGGGLAGLVMAEVEFATVEEAEDFEPPDWFGREVTAEPRYKNRRLALDGLPSEHRGGGHEAGPRNTQNRAGEPGAEAAGLAGRFGLRARSATLLRHGAHARAWRVETDTGTVVLKRWHGRGEAFANRVAQNHALAVSSGASPARLFGAPPDGRACVLEAGDVVTCNRFLEGRALTLDDLLAPETMRALAALLARLHAAPAGAEFAEAFSAVPGAPAPIVFSDRPAALESMRAALEEPTHPLRRVVDLAEILDDLERLRMFRERNRGAPLPRVAAHRDLRPENLLLTAEGPAMLDFEYLALAPRAVDLVGPLFQKLVAARGAPVAERWLPAWLDAYEHELGLGGQALTSDERDTLLQFGRWSYLFAGIGVYELFRTCRADAGAAGYLERKEAEIRRFYREARRLRTPVAAE